MSGISATATMMGAGALLAVTMAALAPPVQAALVQTSARACALAKARVSAARHFPVSNIRSCDALSAANSPGGFYVLALRGFCKEELCGSTLMGWFAVQSGTGRVFEWDVGEMRLGAPIDLHP